MPEATSASTEPVLGRRRALGGAVGVGLGLPVLAACGGDDGGSETAGDTATPSPESAPETPEPETGGGDGGGADVLASTSEVPVGGGVVNTDAKVVVTQPERGEFKAFTAVCTHQGCTVTAVTETISCPCHGSEFAIADGSVVAGPAPSPLAAVEVTVEGGEVLRA
jgi:Rieske Fe-S protein